MLLKLNTFTHQQKEQLFGVVLFDFSMHLVVITELVTQMLIAITSTIYSDNIYFLSNSVSRPDTSEQEL